MCFASTQTQIHVCHILIAAERLSGSANVCFEFREAASSMSGSLPPNSVLHIFGYWEGLGRSIPNRSSVARIIICNVLLLRAERAIREQWL